LSEWEAEGGGVADEFAQGCAQDAALFAGTGDDAGDVTEAFGVFFTLEGSADFLAHFHHADVSLGLVFVLGIEAKIKKIAHDFFPVFGKAVQEIEGFAACDTTALTFRFGWGFGVEDVSCG
jgi:hypothetical protein